VPYCSALFVGVAFTVLIALVRPPNRRSSTRWKLRWTGLSCQCLLSGNQVVVTFDARTTREWLLASLLSVLMFWMMDPIKVTLVTVVLTRCKCKKEKRSLRQVGVPRVHRFIRL
jgi:hypothetical protein